MTEGEAAAEHPDGPSAVLSAVVRDGEPRAVTAGRDGRPHLVFLIPAEVECRSCGDFFSSSLMALVDPGPDGVGGPVLRLEQAEERLLCATCARQEEGGEPRG